MAPPTPLNLISLAKAAAGAPRPVPGTALEVQAVRETHTLTLETSLWLVVLQGELIIDLPHGDFRQLKVGDSLRLEAGLKLTLTPLRETVLLHARP